MRDDGVEIVQESSVGTVLLAARLGRIIVGSAKLTENPLHASHYEADVQVIPSVRRSGVGTSLFNALLERRPMPKPLAAKVVEGTSAHAFFQHLGGMAYQVCPPSTIDFARQDVREWIASLPSITTRSISGLTHQQLLDAWIDMYEWVHEDWSPITNRDAASKEFGPMLQDELNLEASRMVIRDGRTVAAAWVFHTPSDMPLEVVAETTTRNEVGGDDALAACLGAVLADQARRPLPQLELDCHETDPHLGPLLSSVPHVLGDRLVLGHVGS